MHSTKIRNGTHSFFYIFALWKKAIFAAGCFWGVQHYLDLVSGVIKTTVGYTGGHKENPIYEEVKQRMTGHAEAVEVEFDPVLVTFEELCKLLF